MHAMSTSAGKAGCRRVRVQLPLPLDAYDYRVPDDLDVQAGDFVRVPLGPRERVGVVWDTGDDAEDVDDARLRDVVERLDAPPFGAPLRRFIEWVAHYNLAAPGSVLRMAMRDPTALVPPAPITAFRLGGPAPDRLTPARRRVLDVAADGLARSRADLAAAAGVGSGVIKGLVEAGSLETVELPPWPAFPRPLAIDGPALSAAQRQAADGLLARLSEARFSTTLLQGVTGSGKTEVYFEAVAAACKAGQQVLVLLPEIALTAPWLDRFEARFGVAPAVWHSDLRPKDRRRVWRGVALGDVQVVVGARSALFLPFADLGLIVVDEEHESSFKQEDGVCYHARDMAIVRASIGNFPIVLASATPSLETISNVRAGRYQRVTLPERHGGARLPDIALVNMRHDPPPRGCWLSPRLNMALSDTLACGEQAMLFLNRRGYAPLTLCGACGFRLNCPNCSTWLVEHRFQNRLQCHHCGYQTRRPKACPECDEEDVLKACGPGVERLAEEVAEAFPEARLALMTSDTVRGPEAASRLIQAMTVGDIDVLIGTQIVAKGHHFPTLTLVGVVDADLGLAGGDLRAAERTFQLLSQVSGRAGRADRPGRALLQTYRPGEAVMTALVSGQVEPFVDAELAERQAAGMPPFARLAALIVSGPDAAKVTAAANGLARAAPRGPGVDVWGPVVAPLAMVRGRHRQRLLMRTGKDTNIQRLVRQWLARAGPVKGVDLRLDVDPYSFL